MLSLGHLSPSVIRPTDLRNSLLEVKSKLCAQFRLPFEPKEDLWHLYKTLTCTTLINEKKLVVVISIPLLDLLGQFEISSVYNLAVSSLNISKVNGINILAQYDLETNNLAVNKQKTKFMILTSEDARLNGRPGGEGDG